MLKPFNICSSSGCSGRWNLQLRLQGPNRDARSSVRPRTHPGRENLQKPLRWKWGRTTEAVTTTRTTSRPSIKLSRTGGFGKETPDRGLMNLRPWLTSDHCCLSPYLEPTTLAAALRSASQAHHPPPLLLSSNKHHILLIYRMSSCWTNECVLFAPVLWSFQLHRIASDIHAISMATEQTPNYWCNSLRWGWTVQAQIVYVAIWNWWLFIDAFTGVWASSTDTGPDDHLYTCSI